MSFKLKKYRIKQKSRINKKRAISVTILSLTVIIVASVGLAKYDYNIAPNRAAAAVSSTSTVKLFTPAWRGIGSQDPANIAPDYPYVFGNLDPRNFHPANPSLKMIKYNLGPYVTQAYVPGLGNKPIPAEALAKGASGNFIKANDFENWLGVPDNPKWLDYVRSIIDTQLAQNGGSYDGIFIDSMGTAPVSSNYLAEKPINPKTGKLYTEVEWIAAEKVMLQAIVNHVGAGKLVILNGLAQGTNYWDTENQSPRALLTVNGLDGAMSESIWRGATTPSTTFPNYTNWKKDLDMISDVETRGLTGFWWTKCWSGGDTCQDDANSSAIMAQWRRYALGSYLLASGSKSYFNYDTKKSDGNAAEPSVDYNVNIGAPIGAYSEVASTSSGSIMKRSFASGLVIVNPTTASFNFTLPSGNNYVDLDGSSKQGTITLAAHTAQILKSTSTNPSTKPGDLNNDNQVDSSDVAILSTMFGTQGSGISADINQDGYVNIIDFSILLNKWGT